MHHIHIILFLKHVKLIVVLLVIMMLVVMGVITLIVVKNVEPVILLISLFHLVQCVAMEDVEMEQLKVVKYVMMEIPITVMDALQTV